MYKLVIEDDEGKSTVVPIVRDEITIGRKEGNTIRLTERNVSRLHARIVKDGDEIRVENVQSRYGIKHNGDKIKSPTAFKEGDVVMIGDYRLRLQGEKKAKAEKKPIQVPSSGASNAEKTGILDLADAPDFDEAPSGKVGRLVVVSSNYAGREYPLIKGEMVIGRTEGDIRIDHRSISRNHAKIVRDGERYKIIDLRSSNGVRVNGEEYRSVHLKRGDQIELGHVKFRFVAPGERFHYKPDGVPPVAPPGGGMGKIFVGMAGIGLALVVVLLIGFVIVQQMGGENGVEKKVGSDSEVDVGGVVEEDAGDEAVESNEEVTGYLRKAEKAMAREEWEKALVYLEDALELEPNNEEANAKRSQATLEKGMKRTYEDGKAALGRGDHTTAMEKFLEIPENLSIYYKKIKDEGLLQKAMDANIEDTLDNARTLYQNRDLKGALAAVDQILKMDKSNPDARKLRKEILAERNKAAANDPKKGDKNPAADKDQEKTTTDKKVTSTKMDKTERRAKGKEAIKAARQKMSSGSPAECIQKLNEAKKFGVVDNNLFGLCYEKMGNGPMAVKHYNMWLRGNGGSKVSGMVRKKIIRLGGTPVN